MGLSLPLCQLLHCECLTFNCSTRCFCLFASFLFHCPHDKFAVPLVPGHEKTCLFGKNNHYILFFACVLKSGLAGLCCTFSGMCLCENSAEHSGESSTGILLRAPKPFRDTCSIQQQPRQSCKLHASAPCKEDILETDERIEDAKSKNPPAPKVLRRFIGHA